MLEGSPLKTVSLLLIHPGKENIGRRINEVYQACLTGQVFSNSRQINVTYLCALPYSYQQLASILSVDDQISNIGHCQNMKRPYIVYSLSKERTTQKFNKGKYHDILRDIENFFQNCATTNISELTSLELTAFSAYDSTDPAEILKEIIKKTSECFGESHKEPIAFHYPSGEPHSTSKYTWTFSKDRLLEVVQYVADNTPMSKSSLGPLEILFTYDFKLVDPVSKNELENQEHLSSLLVWFSRGKSCSPTLFFPFEKADKNFWDYVDKIIPYLPFQLEEKYLRIAHVNRNGEVKSFKKINRPSLI